MILEKRCTKVFRALILPALVLAVLGGFMLLGSESAQADTTTTTIFEFSKYNNTTLKANGAEETLLLHSSSYSLVANPATWNSSNDNVAHITAKNEKQVRIAPKTPGTAVISVTSIDGSKTAECTITVVAKKDFGFTENQVRLDPDSVDFYTLDLKNDYADSYDYDECVYYESSDDSVADIDETSSNTCCCLNIYEAGTTTITATDPYDNVAQCTLTVAYEGLKLDTESITIDYKYDPYEEFDPDEVYCSYQNYVIGNIGQATWIMPKSGKITEVYSNDPDIVSVRDISWEYNGAWAIIPTGKGTGSLVCVGEDGDKQTLTVTVPAAYMNSYMKYHASCYAPYGGQVRIKAPATSDVSIVYGGKTYKKTDVSGTTYFDVPVKKLGTAVTCSINYGNYIYKINGKVTASASSIKTGTIYRSTKKTRIRLTNVHKGDMVWVKVGKKTIKKKINKNAASYSCTVKLPKKKTAGKKVRITLKNKYKQSMKTVSKKIWYASKVRKGMTKKQCKLVPAFGSPDRWYRYGRFESWYYDHSYYGYARLTFKNGRLWSWWY